MTKLRPILNHIIFQFEDELVTAKGRKQFASQTDWGFKVIADFDNDVKSPRWVRVVSVGPKVSGEITEGSRILVEALQWTEGAKFEGQEYWMTNEDKVLAVEDPSS